MLLFPPRLEIGNTEGFLPDKDIFGRAVMGKGLTNLVGSVSDPLVIAVDGQWGSGKTTFLKMWAGDLRNEGFPVIYFDAFAHDYVADAFSAVAGEIIALVKEKKKLKTTGGKKFAQRTLDVAKVVARAGIGIGIKAATLGAIDGSELADVAEDIGDAVKNSADSYLEKFLSERQEDRDAIVSFQKALSELPQLIAAKKTEDETSTKALIFIIDELDRCRPPFALAILERMKHFFSVPNIHFVLGMNREQIHNSIALLYGSKIDANEYLQKFIQIYFFLHDNAIHRHEQVVPKFIRYLKNAMQFEKSEDVGTICDIIEDIAIRNDVSLRAIEKIMSTVAIALTYTPPKTRARLPVILSGLAVLKVLYPAQYKKAKRGVLTKDDVRNVLGLGIRDEKSSINREWIDAWWSYVLTGSDDGGRFNEFRWNYNFTDPKAVVPYLANEVIDRFVLS